MRRWHWISGIVVLLMTAIGCWYYAHSTDGGVELHLQANIGVKDDGNAEASDVIEPLVVECTLPVIVETREPPLAPPTRVTLDPGMRQPARPDANPDRPLLMPYADD